VCIFIAVVLAVLIASWLRGGVDYKEVSWNEFYSDFLEKKDVSLLFPSHHTITNNHTC